MLNVTLCGFLPGMALHCSLLKNVPIASLVKIISKDLISSHTLFGMWLLIHAGIKVNPCQ